jgi:hypothetical protein
VQIASQLTRSGKGLLIEERARARFVLQPGRAISRQIRILRLGAPQRQEITSLLSLVRLAEVARTAMGFRWRAPLLRELPLARRRGQNAAG